MTAAPQAAVKAEDAEPGQVIKSGGRPAGSLADSKGTRHPLAACRGDDYPMRPVSGPPDPEAAATAWAVQDPGFPVIPPRQAGAAAGARPVEEG